MSLGKFLKERDAAFEAGDLSWASRMFPIASSQHLVEAAFHKARAATPTVSEKRRIESLQWLKDNKFGEFGQFWRGDDQ